MQYGPGPPSGPFLAEASNLSKTGHECRLTEKVIDKFGLSADIATSYIDVGLSEGHPILSVSAFVQYLNASDKLDFLLMQHRANTFESFWHRWKKQQPRHPIYTTHQSRLGFCIPIGVHCDEGTTLKKKSMMSIQWQPIIGRGTRKRKGSNEEPGCNFLGDSYKTRFLWSVMLGRLYSGNKKER